MKKKNTILKSLLVSALLLFCLSGLSFGSPTTYPMTVQELNELQSIFSELGSINKTLSSELKLSKEDLANHGLRLEALEIRLSELGKESKLAKEELMKAQSSLSEVKKSYEEYKAEMNRKLKIKDRQKIVIGILATGLGVAVGTALNK